MPIRKSFISRWNVVTKLLTLDNSWVEKPKAKCVQGGSDHGVSGQIEEYCGHYNDHNYEHSRGHDVCIDLQHGKRLSVVRSNISSWSTVSSYSFVRIGISHGSSRVPVPRRYRYRGAPSLFQGLEGSDFDLLWVDLVWGIVVKGTYIVVVYQVR